MRLKMGPIIFILLLSLFNVSTSYAYLVVPGALENVAGDSNNSMPFNVHPSRYQQIYAATGFNHISGPVTITGISFRQDEQIGSPFENAVGLVQIDLSTSSQTVTSMSTNFAENVGADNTIVRNLAPLTLSSFDIGPGLRDFDIFINFDTPFQYDPELGDLLLDIRRLTGGQLQTTIFDAQNGPISGILVMSNLSNGDPTATSGSRSIGAGLVTQFHTADPIPEPATIALLGIGLVGLAGVEVRRRRKKAKNI